MYERMNYTYSINILMSLREWSVVSNQTAQLHRYSWCVTVKRILSWATFPFLCLYCNVFDWLETPFGLLIGFINNLKVVTTLTYNTVTHLHSLHTNLFTLSAAVFTYSVSLSHTLQIKPSVHNLHLHRQTSYILLVYDWLGCRCIPFENWTVTADGLQNNSSARTPRKTVSLLL
jgi:hypothetical protein